MAKEPELMIGYDDDHHLCDAVCSACGEHMPWPEEGFQNSSVAIALLSGLFEIHLEHSHSDNSATGTTGDVYLG